MSKEGGALRKQVRQPWLFVVPSRMGFSVRTTRGYWSLITLVKHPSLAGKEQAVLRTLTEPDEIRVSKTDRAVHLFYRRFQKKHLCVVVKRINERMGFIMTAYFTEKVKEGHVAWKR